MPKKLKGDPLGFSSFILSQNIKKLKGGNFYFRKKISQCRKKLKGGTLWDFPTSILSQNSKKMKGGPFEEKNSEKSLAVPKILKGRTIWPRPVWYVTRENKTFWFSSLGQMVQFGAIIFCRTFKNYFGQFVWIEKSHYNSRVSLHEAPTKNVTTVRIVFFLRKH